MSSFQGFGVFVHINPEADATAQEFADAALNYKRERERACV